MVLANSPYPSPFPTYNNNNNNVEDMKFFTMAPINSIPKKKKKNLL